MNTMSPAHTAGASAQPGAAPPVLWQPGPEQLQDSLLARFLAGRFADYHSAWRWSCDQPEAFWSELWDFAGVIGDKGSRILDDPQAMPGAQFFPQARLNYAENLLRPRDPDSIALWFRGEDKVETKLTFGQLVDQVTRLRAALQAMGVGPGDRVAAFLPNLPQAIVAVLATSALGAVWCSASPDFGVDGVLDRFGQIQPKVLIACDGYWFKGRAVDCLERLAGIRRGLPSLTDTILVPYVQAAGDLQQQVGPGVQLWDTVLASAPAWPLTFSRVAFNHPLFILFSSGTTGVPKCIVHGVGGTLLQHLKEHQLHCDIRPGDRVFYFTTLGWMMWNWLVSGLASGATLCLFDGNPFWPGPGVLFDYASDARFTLFGTSAKYLDALAKDGFTAHGQYVLDDLRLVTSTGSPLSPEGFDYVARAIRPGVQLASISGGTDIVSCFVLGCPILPVHRGEIQCRGLGLDVDVVDDQGLSVVGQKGELVCRRPFPCMPIGFWNDPDQARYRAAYFEAWPGLWHHGDFVELTPRGGMIIYGRSDATLNPGGVRIGTAEIYRAVEQLPEVLESLCIGQEVGDDVRVVLFVRLRAGVALEDRLIARIKATIRDRCTPRHVPAVVLEVADIPRTKSGKITELAVREVVHGRPVRNIEALANPDALALFADRPELALD